MSRLELEVISQILTELAFGYKAEELMLIVNSADFHALCAANLIKFEKTVLGESPYCMNIKVRIAGTKCAPEVVQRVFL